jgi:hypothetical protein
MQIVIWNFKVYSRDNVKMKTKFVIYISQFQITTNLVLVGHACNPSHLEG